MILRYGKVISGSDFQRSPCRRFGVVGFLISDPKMPSTDGRDVVAAVISHRDLAISCCAVR